MYSTKLLNDFHTLLFYSNTTSTESVTQNTKTDSIDEFDCFADWFDNLINVFIDEISYNVTKEDVLKELATCSQFIDDMESEYSDLQELCEDDEE